MEKRATTKIIQIYDEIQPFVFGLIFIVFLLIVSSRNAAIANITNLSQKVIKPGLIHHSFTKTINRGEVKINLLEIDLKAGYTVKPALANQSSIWGRASLKEIVARENALAGLNASFFTSSGMTINSLAIDKEWLTGPVLNRASFSIGEKGEVFFARPLVTGRLQVYSANDNNSLISSYLSAASQTPSSYLLVSNINQPTSLAKQDSISFYNHWWQEKITCGGGIACALVDGNNKIRTRIFAYESKTPIQPGRTGYVLAAKDERSLAKLSVGSLVSLSWNSTPDWSRMKHVIGGGPYLISKGQIVLNEELEHFTNSSGVLKVAPRTAIGITKPGNLIWLTADGRQKDSVGLDLYELASLMKEIGIYEAMNLDGGGSTSMILDGEIVNSPSGGSLRSVSTALVLLSPS
ncbi:MAG TPA: phosphodiester glycosidase family protein [Vampirovibrionales bacterium]